MYRKTRRLRLAFIKVREWSAITANLQQMGRVGNVKGPTRRARPAYNARMKKQRLYRVIFQSGGEVYEIYARNVSQGVLFGFVEIADLVFGERSELLVDPAEEKLKAQFEGVACFHVPMHAVMRIDEVDKQGVARIETVDGGAGKVTPFPVYTQPRSES